MNAPVEFWFDFGSPYAYLASRRLPALCARHGRALAWRPVLLFAVLRRLQVPAVMAHAARQAYLRIDVERSARHMGVPYRHPARFPVVTPWPARLFYTLQARHDEAAQAFAAAELCRVFRDGGDADDTDAIAAAAARCDCRSATELLALADGDVGRAALAGAIEQAAANAVFGSPFVRIDGEPFFGADRLPQIEARLGGTPAPTLTEPA